MPYYQNIEVNKEQEMKENFADKKEQKEPKIKVIGIGQTGQFVTDYLADELENVEIFSLQCNKEFLENSKLDNEHKVLIGEDITHGMGTGGNPKLGEKIAQSSENVIRKVLQGADSVIIVSGYSGGLGSGATPFLTKIAKEMDMLSIVFAVMPTKYEGQRKNNFAREKLQILVEEKNTDAILNVSRENFIENMKDQQCSLLDTFDLLNKETAKGIKNIVDIFQKGLISVDYDSIKNFFENSGFIGMGFCEKTTDINEAIKETLNYPMLKGSLDYAEKLILNIKCGENVSFATVHKISSEILENVDKNVEVLVGYEAVDGFSPDEFQIVIITA